VVCLTAMFHHEVWLVVFFYPFPITTLHCDDNRMKVNDDEMERICKEAVVA
jgi:hypothetical protein